MAVYGGNLPRIYGTLPQGDGSYHWWEALDSTMVLLTKSLGTNATSGVNYGPIDGPIFSLAQINSGPYIIVGNFKHAFGMALNGVAQLNSILTGLDNTTNNFNDTISSLGGANFGADQILINEGQPILSGIFTSFNGTPCGHITRLNYSPSAGYGTVDTAFNTNAGIGADDRPFRLYQPTGSSSLQILGAFKHYYNATTDRGGIATLDVNGNLQSSYADVAANSSTPGTVYAVNKVYLPTGQFSGQLDIVIGGDFTGVNGKYNQNLAYLNLDGSLDPDRAGMMVEGGPVKSISEEWNGQVLVAGNFARAKGYGCTGLARLNSDSSFDTNFKPIISQANGTSADLHRANYEDSTSHITISGMFAKIADASHTLQPRSVIALLYDNGTLYDYFDAKININGGTNFYGNDGGQVGGGNYGVAGYVKYGDSNYGFAAILNDKGEQQTYKLFNGEVLEGTGLGDGRLVLVGKFTQVVSDQANRGHIAALKSDWSLDSSFAGAGANGPINAICSQGTDMDATNGNILIGGSFSSYNGTPINNLARLNRSGGLDTSFNPGTGPNNTVYALYWSRWWNYMGSPSAAKALLGGAFTSYDATPMPGVAKVLASAGVNVAPINFLLLDN